MGSVRIFRKSGIGLDYYKGKEFMSRVVVLQIIIIQMEVLYGHLIEDLMEIQQKSH